MDINDLEQLSSRYGRLYLALMRLLDRRLAEQGVSLARTKLLIYLHKHGPKRAADIAAFFSQAPRTVTEAIDGLERAGLVLREADANDRRSKPIALTDAGRQAVSATEPLRLRLVERVFGVLDESEAAGLDAVLAKLAAAVEAEERGAGG